VEKHDGHGEEGEATLLLALRVVLGGREEERGLAQKGRKEK